MSKESYVRGFCKAAEAAGVDPVALAKFAETYGPIEHPEYLGNVPKPVLREYEGKPMRGPTKEDISSLAEASDKTNTNPSLRDLDALASISPEVLRGDIKGLKVNDYLNAMYGVNPDATTKVVDMIRNAKGPEFSSVVSRNLSDEKGAMLRFPYMMAQMPGYRPVAKLNYATATNMLDRIGKKTGRPIWDVKNARPTPYGLGISVK